MENRFPQTQRPYRQPKFEDSLVDNLFDCGAALDQQGNVRDGGVNVAIVDTELLLAFLDHHFIALTVRNPVPAGHMAKRRRGRGQDCWRRDIGNLLQAPQFSSTFLTPPT